MEFQSWPEKLLIRGRSGTQYVAMLNLTAENQTFLVQIGRDISFHHIWYLGCVYDVITANLPILKTWVSLERKEIFENSKQHFSSPLDYLFMFQNGLDTCRKDAIFFMVPLLKKGTHFGLCCLFTGDSSKMDFPQHFTPRKTNVVTPSWLVNWFSGLQRLKSFLFQTVLAMHSIR